MKSLSLIIGLSGAALLTLGIACSKQEPAAPAAANEPQKALESAATEAKKAADALQSGAASVQEAAKQTVAAAQTQAKEATSAVAKAAEEAQAQAAAVTSKTQATFDAVKKLLAEKKPAEALKMLSDLATAKLTPEQQSALEALKKQAEALLQNATTSQATEKAAEAAGGLLKK